MTELIARGQARLVFAEGKNICLQDKVSGAYFHTAEDIKAAPASTFLQDISLS